jgi:S-DNA-T family DNA segregation ATPase FtsK/SpoIIIE
LDLLVEPPAEVVESTDSDTRAKLIRDTLRSFGIDVDVVDIKVGSSVTQYSLQPKSVTKVSKIASLHENLALALASPTGSVRIEAPIPGKSLIAEQQQNVGVF